MGTVKALVKNAYQFIIPDLIRDQIAIFRADGRYKELRRNILKYYNNLNPVNLTSEEREVVTYIKKHPLSVFPYSFAKKYSNIKINVLFDKDKNLPFVYWKSQKLYFREDWDAIKISSVFRSLLIEQDINSPHRYMTNRFNVGLNDIIADVGAAEGNFSLSIVDKVKELFLFEADPMWIQPLSATFEPWQHKVTIINKYVSDTTSPGKIALDDYFQGIKINLLKADIEGGEADMLKGSENLLKEPGIRVAICTYHKQEDASIFMKFFSERNFEVSFSDGLMIFLFDNNLDQPFFRKAVLRAEKKPGN